MKQLLMGTILLLSNETEAQETAFTSAQHSDQATIHLKGPVEQVFPLFGPVAEMEWAKGWQPVILYPVQARMEERMIFRTQPRFEREEPYRWILSKLDETEHVVQYTVTTNGRIWFIDVACVPVGEKETRSTITYTYVSLDESGRQRNEQALESMFAFRLRDWEEAINYYLQTGKMLD